MEFQHKNSLSNDYKFWKDWLIMYAVATTVESFGEQYLTKDGWFSMNLFIWIYGRDSTNG